MIQMIHMIHTHKIVVRIFGTNVRQKLLTFLGLLDTCGNTHMWEHCMCVPIFPWTVHTKRNHDRAKLPCHKGHVQHTDPPNQMRGPHHCRTIRLWQTPASNRWHSRPASLDTQVRPGLYCIIPCCTMLYSAVVCYAVRCYDIQNYFVLCCTIRCCTVRCYMMLTVLYWAVTLYFIVLCYTELCWAELCYAAMCCTVLCCDILPRVVIVVRCNLLCHAILYCYLPRIPQSRDAQRTLR